MLKDYSSESYPLTVNEQRFIKGFMGENGCGAKTPGDLLNDNYSWQCIEDLRTNMKDLSNRQIAGYLSSLQDKGVLGVEVRDGKVFESTCKNEEDLKVLRDNFEADLYWVLEEYLTTIPSNLQFAEVV